MAAEKELFSKELLGTFKEDTEAGEFEAILKDLPKEKNFNDRSLCHYQGYWIPDLCISGVASAQKNFVARDDDIIVTSCLKSGTTWLKALVFSIVNRARDTKSPLLEANPHDLVPWLEDVNHFSNFEFPNSEAYPQVPRLLNTHIPYELLPPSIITSGCKTAYISRNPMDLFVSLWHFTGKYHCEDVERHSLEGCFDRFSRGIHSYGPFWNHVLGFWKASLERPEKILFLTYEDLKEDPVFNVKRLAEFLGFPFSEEEEKQGVVEEIIAICSFETMKTLEVNKSGKHPVGVPYSAYFRKGEVGDSKNFLTPAMMESMEKLVQEKFGDYPCLISKFSA